MKHFQHNCTFMKLNLLEITESSSYGCKMECTTFNSFSFQVVFVPLIYLSLVYDKIL